MTYLCKESLCKRVYIDVIQQKILNNKRYPNERILFAGKGLSGIEIIRVLTGEAPLYIMLYQYIPAQYLGLLLDLDTIKFCVNHDLLDAEGKKTVMSFASEYIINDFDMCEYFLTNISETECSNTVLYDSFID